jgi:hypothetical protein
MNPIEDLLNQMIAGMLPQINGAIQQNIRSNNLDPWGQVAHGSEGIGSIDLIICDASVGANYNVGNMRGLSSITINSITVSNTQDDPQDPAKLVGNISVVASMAQNLNAGLWGNVEAKCGFAHPSVSIDGSATVSGLRASAAGFFSASQTDDALCLDSISVSNMNVDYSELSVHIDSLGVFGFLLDPLVNVIVGAFKGQITGAIASALKPAVNSEVNKMLPQCQSL